MNTYGRGTDGFVWLGAPYWKPLYDLASTPSDDSPDVRLDRIVRLAADIAHEYGEPMPLLARYALTPQRWPRAERLYRLTVIASSVPIADRAIDVPLDTTPEHLSAISGMPLDLARATFERLHAGGYL